MLLLWAAESDTGTCSHAHDKKFNTTLILLSQICIMIARQWNIAPAALVFNYVITCYVVFGFLSTNQPKVDLVTGSFGIMQIPPVSSRKRAQTFLYIKRGSETGMRYAISIFISAYWVCLMNMK